MISTRASVARLEASRVEEQAIDNGAHSLLSCGRAVVAPTLTEQASVVPNASLMENREITPTNSSPSHLDKVAFLAPARAPRIVIRPTESFNACGFVTTNATVKSAKRARPTSTGKAKTAPKRNGTKATHMVAVKKGTSSAKVSLPAPTQICTDRFALLLAAAATATRLEAERVEVEMAAVVLASWFSTTSRKRSAEDAEIDKAPRTMKTAWTPGFSASR
ncbi:hypothetical protein JCM11641_008397 [Rhodosporidiobolus odoratus]